MGSDAPLPVYYTTGIIGSLLVPIIPFFSSLRGCQAVLIGLIDALVFLFEVFPDNLFRFGVG